MVLDFQRARPLLQSCDLPKLFVEELGWEPCRQKLSLRAGEQDYTFTALAEKRGFIAWLCEAPNAGLPDHATRLKLDRKLSETSFEHLIVFVTGERSSQSWLWVRREQGKPLAARTHEYHRGQPGDSLLQKLQILYVSLEEEEAGLSTVAVAGRARAAFDIERVTKAFYRDFDTHRKAFLEFIDGFPPPTKVDGRKKFDPDQEWYASVMLNRLMFVYFIQRKGFLDGDHNYLRNRLDSCKREQGKDKFYTFYRYFLLRLFHEGFGKRRKDRAADLEKLLGNIPYLNGGLFDVHELEKPERYGKDIQLPDKAFERVFDYFDQYQWHLDERPLRKDDEINPDVLGYIFEKYINQKQMGAYYTKEDITEYISKNTVLPFLFDSARAKCKVVFENPNGPTVWDLLRENPDRYIYPAVRHGADKKLPPEIAAGLDTTKPNLIERRKGWNKPAPGEYALPTETWREVVARRQLYEEVRRKLVGGEVREVNDFITLNLDLRQFAQDTIQNCEGPDLLMAFWQAITTITVLDPTGGSGAFIFAALNILEPLYEGCLDRMEAFLAEWGDNGRKAHPNYHKKFTEVLTRVYAHPNRRYFVLKSIILNNLYAVDIMEEAVEICKLRLFLKLAAQVEPDNTKDNLGIEPLPDIDFNIRAGNTLVGYATAEEVRHSMKESGGGQMKLMHEEGLATFDRFNTRCADVEQAFTKFRKLQTDGDGSVPAADKLELQKRFKALEDELNRHLAGEYGVKVSDKAAYAKWVKSHQPFHWFIQFYGILNSGGFDVIIGNPPYVPYPSEDVPYLIHGYITKTCKNLYGYVTERTADLANSKTRLGLIVPMSVTSIRESCEVRIILKESFSQFWITNHAIRPASLFTGISQRVSILFASKSFPIKEEWITNYLRVSGLLTNPFQQIRYGKASELLLVDGLTPKISSIIEQTIYEKINQKQKNSALFSETGRWKIHFKDYGETYWIFPMNVVPYKTPVKSYKYLSVSDQSLRDATVAVFNSSLFYWFYTAVSDCWHFGKWHMLNFPVGWNEMPRNCKAGLADLSEILMKDFKSNRITRYDKRINGDLFVYKVNQSKPIIDEIDNVLAEHYGFTAEELDFIVNYDIQYRLGCAAENEEE